MKKLIVNADDFGRTHGINLGVFECFKHGIVTSSTIMINMPFAKEAIQIASDNQIPIGLHLNITGGETFFTGSNYLFGDKGKVKKVYKNGGRLTAEDMDIIIKEYEAQIDQFRLISGKTPTHLDHHHNVQEIDGYLDRYLTFIKKINLPTRSRHRFFGVKSPVAILDNFFTLEELNKEHLFELISSLSDGVSELITHPSLIMGEQLDSYTEEPRFKQVQLLTDPEIKQAIESAGVQLVSYKDL